MTTLERTRLLIIDDWGPEPLNAEQRRDLLEIIDDRDQKGFLLMTSQVPIPPWHEIIGDPTLGEAIIDRVIHRAHRLELKGDSLRKRSAIATTEGLTNGKEKRDLINGQWQRPGATKAVGRASFGRGEQHGFDHRDR